MAEISSTRPLDPFCRFFYETVPDISFAVGILAPFSSLLHGYGFLYE
jgi:hypothetical protein